MAILIGSDQPVAFAVLHAASSVTASPLFYQKTITTEIRVSVPVFVYVHGAIVYLVLTR